jgi:uncharacterized protein
MRVGSSIMICTTVAAALFSSIIAATSDPGIVQAVKDKDKAAVRRLLQQKIDVNEQGSYGATALHWAAHWDDLETVGLLIAAGAKANVANDLKLTPLALASANGNTAIVDSLLKSGADPNAAGESGVTPLMQAARTGSVDTVRVLLSHGANVNAKENDRQQTALMWAVSQKHPAVVAALLEGGADVHARTRARSEMVMLDRGPIRNNSQVTGFVKTADKVGTLIETGGTTALLFAAESGDSESAKLLVAAGAEINEAAADGNSPVVLATFSGQGTLARWLLDAGADPNAGGAGYTALHAAVLRSDLETVKALLAHGANPNTRLTKGSPVKRNGSQWALSNALKGATPLLLAAAYLETDIMKVLLANGADPAIGLAGGTTPLLAAAGVDVEVESRPTEQGRRGEARPENRAVPTVQLLLDAAVDVNAVNEAGDTALHGAAGKGFADVIQLLADKGAKLDAKNQNGKTPLALASGEGKLDLFGMPVPEGQLSPAQKKAQELLRKLGATN